MRSIRFFRNFIGSAVFLIFLGMFNILSLNNVHAQGSSFPYPETGGKLNPKIYSPYYMLGFNKKEKLNEAYGEGNAYDIGARMYDPRTCRWLARDPHADTYPHISPYVFVLNQPIVATDPDGKDVGYSIFTDENGKTTITVTVTGKVIDVSDTWLINADKIANGINKCGEKWLSKKDFDVSGINFGTEEKPLFFDKADIKFDFQFERAAAMSDIKPSDHVVYLADFMKIKQSDGSYKQVADGVSGYKGKSSFIDADQFVGPLDYITGRGYNVALHEIWTHNFGNFHTEDPANISYGGSVTFWSNDATKYEMRSFLGKMTRGELNKGSTTTITKGGKIIPNYVVKNMSGENVDVKDASVNKESTTENAEKKQ